MLVRGETGLSGSELIVQDVSFVSVKLGGAWGIGSSEVNPHIYGHLVFLKDFIYF